jgi:hypothetical protein
MKRQLVAVSMAASLALAGCSSSATTTSSPTPSEKLVTTAPTPTPTVDDYASCEQVGMTIEDNATIVTGIVDDPTGVSLDKQMLYRTTAALRNADETASPKMKGYLAPYSAVAFALEAIYAGEIDPAQNLDTGGYRDALIEVLNYCTNEIGYSAQ